MKATAQVFVWLTASVCAVGATAPVSQVPDTVEALDRMAANYRNEGKLAEAEDLNRRAIEAAGAGETVQAMIGLARTLCVETNYREADAVALDAEARADKHGEDHARALGVLGLIDREQLRYVAAEHWYRESAAAFEQIAGPDDPATAIARADLGYVLTMEGKRREAQALLDRSLPVLLRTDGPARPETASALTTLGLIYQSSGKYRQAERTLRQALKTDRAALGQDSIRTANDAANLGYLEFQRRHYAEAEALVSRAAAIERSWPGPAPLLKGLTLADLAAIYVAEKRLDDAEPLYREAAEILQKSAGTGDTRIANVLAGYASLLRALHRCSEAEALEVRATAIKVQNAQRTS